jgi:hypothetical protein
MSGTDYLAVFAICPPLANPRNLPHGSPGQIHDLDITLETTSLFKRLVEHERVVLHVVGDVLIPNIVCNRSNPRKVELARPLQIDRALIPRYPRVQAKGADVCGVVLVVARDLRGFEGSVLVLCADLVALWKYGREMEREGGREGGGQREEGSAHRDQGQSSSKNCSAICPDGVPRPKVRCMSRIRWIA